MSRFYIEKLVVSGGGHKPSIIEFGEGLNFVLGPSNTGKSLVMECLDYAFGFKPKKDHPSKIVDNNYGYENITLYLRTDSGTVVLERKIGDSKISVSGTDPNINHDKYSIDHKAKKNISAIYLQLLGIDDTHEVRSAEEGSKTQALTWRSMLHLFFLKQSDVARETSALLAPGSVGKTASAAVLLFLLTGVDANNLSGEEDPKIGEARKKALVTYIKDKVNSLGKRREQLEDELAAVDVKDANVNIDDTKANIKLLQQEIDRATKEASEIMAQIYALNGKLTECRTIGHNFEILRQQYQSDVKRIGFIANGAAHMSPAKRRVKCPICGEETDSIVDTSFIEASSYELEKIKKHLAELGDAQKSISERECVITGKIRELEEKREALGKLIEEELQPQLAEFQDKLEQNLYLIRVSSELEVVKKDELQYSAELFQKENEEVPGLTKHSIFEDYDFDTVHGFEEVLRAILKESNVGGASTARLNMENFDIEIDKKKKSVSMGGGFCGILNTIMTLAMSKYLIDKNRPAPGFYAVDSSLTQLSEAEYKAQGETIKQNFVQYLVKNAASRQIIIVEQTKRMPFIPEEDKEKKIHVVRFTGNKEEGRYGFLNDVFNPEGK